MADGNETEEFDFSRASASAFILALIALNELKPIIHHLFIKVYVQV